jgi:acyl-CoA thioester hydrolase
MTEATVVETTFPVRYAETDSMRIVHHSNYLVYFEEGRSAYARERGAPYTEFENEGLFLTVTDVQVRYHRPAYYEQLITVRAWVTAVQSRGLTFEYEIVDAESHERIVTGQTKHICIDTDGKVARIPEGWRIWAQNK